jgi:glycyl-tRNA synthetase
MVEHQRYFPVADAEGALKNLFVITANILPTDEIKHGNQKVISARLSDGIFLYEQDLKVPFEQFNEKLKHVTLQKELGTVYDKVQRIIAHTHTLQHELKISDQRKAKRAAELSKADLASGMVYEFPELQGIIGKYYALTHSEDREVAQAIEEHWMPRGENAPLPVTPTGILVSLADKIDNLLGCFFLDLKPTSSSDPYALRRQVLGMIKILIKGKYRLPLMDIFRDCAKHFPANLVKRKEEVLKEIEAFITNRIKTVFQDYGFSKDEIEASVSFGFTDIYDTFCRVKALHDFRQKGDRFFSLYEVYKRAKGQLNGQVVRSFSQKLLSEKAEIDLDKLLNNVQNQFERAISSHDYDHAYDLVAQIQPGLASLFDEVKILADDPKIRDNRIALLQRVFDLFAKLLDFSKIQETI